MHAAAGRNETDLDAEVDGVLREGEVADDRQPKVGMCLETEDEDGDYDEEDGYDGHHLTANNHITSTD